MIDDDRKSSLPSLRDSESSLASTQGVELWFEKLLSEIRVLTAEVEHESGILFLKAHTLSEKQVVAHPSMVRIRAMCGQIDDLYQRWCANKAITADEYKLYIEKRIEVERALGTLRVRIVERKPTFLDLILRALEVIVEFVRHHMEQLGDNLLKRVGYVDPWT